MFTFSNKIMEKLTKCKTNKQTKRWKITTFKCRMCIWWNLLTLECYRLEEKIRKNWVNIETNSLQFPKLYINIYIFILGNFIVLTYTVQKHTAPLNCLSLSYLLSELHFFHLFSIVCLSLKKKRYFC